jgi:hypothetical protein
MTNGKNALLGVEMTYQDTEGRKKLLHQMVRDEPEWAASRIRVCEQLEGVTIPELHARIFELENEIRSLHRRLHGDKCSCRNCEPPTCGEHGDW